MSERDVISVPVQGYYSQDVAGKVGMYEIRKLTGVTDAQLVKVWHPDLSRPTFWRVEASYIDSGIRTGHIR